MRREEQRAYGLWYSFGGPESWAWEKKKPECGPSDMYICIVYILCIVYIVVIYIIVVICYISNKEAIYIIIYRYILIIDIWFWIHNI